MTKCFTLPSEIWQRIFDHLIPRLHPAASTFPNLLTSSPLSAEVAQRTRNRSLLALALSCKRMELLVRQVINEVLLLSTDHAVSSFMSSINSFDPDILDQPEQHRCRMIRAIHLPYCPLGAEKLFVHGTQIDFVSLEIGEECYYLHDLLDHFSNAHPRRLTILHEDVTELDLEGRSLDKLSKLTHLHLIRTLPSPALISFLVGFPIDANYSYALQDAIQDGISPCNSLECMRLSGMGAAALCHFDDYVAWRQDLKAYHQLPLGLRVERDAPLPPDRRSDVHKALFDLATNAAKMPKLRLLILESSRYECLPVPPVVRIARPGHTETVTLASTETHDSQYSGRPTSRHSPWFGAAIRRDLSRMDPDDDDNMAATLLPNDMDELRRVTAYDRLWRRVEAGKLALIGLWRQCRLDGTSGISSVELEALPEIEIRVTALRKHGWDTDEVLHDLQCQVDNVPFGSRIRLNSHEGMDREVQQRGDFDGPPAKDVGSWADPDLFSLVRAAPWLSFREAKRSDGRPGICYWTGELPRETLANIRPGERKHTWIPSIIDMTHEGLDQQARQELQERDGFYGPQALP